MKQLTLVQRILMILIAVVMAVTFLLNVVKVAQPVAGAQAAGYGFFAMLRYALIENPIESLKNITNDITAFYKLKQENDYYRSQLEMLALYKAELEEAYRQIAQLKELADIKTAANEYQLSSAKVIYRSFDTFNHALVINLGSDDGVIANQAVITTKGLIGKIAEVGKNSSVVRLLTTQDVQNKVAVKIQLSPSTSAEAILERYDPNRGAYVLQLLDTNSAVLKDMTVITSGLGGVFPAGLLVGSVSEVEQLVNAIGMKIYVTPSANFRSFDYVFVVNYLQEGPLP
ncbi:MAG: rod shape-determining protein MreC [Firmicutes bacterium HGW-Firmicutes-10]|nr:MAG: rod shape-determining protein MreC [Firmicutes bacterium HGW-Firmicutes-10]